MEQLGYSVVDSDDKEIQAFGTTIGLFHSMPEVIFLQNGDVVYAPELGKSYGGYRLIERWIDNQPPSKFHRKLSETVEVTDKLVITVNYETSPTMVPESVSPLQIRRALRLTGLKDTIDAYINAVPDPDVKDAWEYAVEIRSDNPLIASAATALGKTQQDLEDLFRLASTL